VPVRRVPRGAVLITRRRWRALGGDPDLAAAGGVWRLRRLGITPGTFANAVAPWPAIAGRPW
jgi:hypothetical protein